MKLPDQGRNQILEHHHEWQKHLDKNLLGSGHINYFE